MEENSNFSKFEAPSQQDHHEMVASALKQFYEQFPSDGHCIEEIIKRLNADFCKLCGSILIDRKFGQRKLRCYSCRATSWPLAGTFFERMKRPRLYLGVILLMEKGITVSAKSLEKLFGTAYATVFELLQRIRIAIISLLSGDVRIQTSAFAKMLFRRSMETLAGKHPSIAEEEEEEEEEEEKQAGAAFHGSTNGDEDARTKADLYGGDAVPELASSSNATEIGKETLEERVKLLLSSEPISFEEIISQTQRAPGEISAALTMLELFQQAVRLPGDRYTSPTRAISVNRTGRGKANELVRSMYTFVRHYFGGISRRYLQSYIGSFWINADRRRWTSGALFKAIKDYGKVYDKTLNGLSGKAQILFPH